MTPEMWLVSAVIVLPLTLVALNRWRVDVAALFMIVVLGLAQYLGLGVLADSESPQQALLSISGFSQPVVVTLIGLLILTQTLTSNGVMLWLGQRLAAVSERSISRLIFMFASSSALFSQFMNNVAVGALLLPTAMQVARRAKVRPSKLLIPIAFGTALGGMATYFTTANIVMSNLLTVADPPQAALGVLSFFATGGLIALAGMFYLAAFGQRSLPRREARFEQEFARRAGTELEDLYAVGEHLWEARVQESSDFLGLTLKDSGIGQKFGVVVAAMRRGRHAFFVPLMSEMLQQDDILLIVGQEDRVSILAKLGLQVRPETHTLTDFGLSLLEIILMPHSAYVGKTLKEINFRNRYGFVAIALLHEQHSHRTDIAKMPLELGDSLLMLGSQKHLRDLRANPNIIIFEPDPSMRPVPRRRAVISIMLFLTAIVLSIAGVPVYLSVLTAALLAILFGFLSIQDAYRSLEWQVIFFVAGMYVASLSMIHTGLAALIGRAAIDLIGNAGPLGLAASAFWLSALLTQFMGSQATAFVVGPIAISVAIHLNANPQAIAVATAIGCSASFLTPFSHPVNLIMVGPGNYRFGDFFRVGAGLMVVVFITLLIGMTLFWRL